MEPIYWKLSESMGAIDVLMMADGSKLYTTSSVLAPALGTTQDSLRMLYMRNKEEFDGLSVTSSYALDFLRANKSKFNLPQVHGSMHVWTENDMVLMILLSRTPNGKQLRREFIEFVKQHAIRTSPTQVQLDEMREQLKEMQESLAQALPSLHSQASNAGHLLNAQKGTRHLRLVN